MLWDALIVVVMATSLVLYFRGIPHIRAAKWEAPAFVLGLLTIAIALLSPVDSLADVLFSVHMTQHELLMIVAAPLLVVGRPFATILWGLPMRARNHAATLVRGRVLLTLWRRVTGPMTVLVLHAIVLWAWQIPTFFQAALRNDAIHALQHLMFFVTAAVFWWALTHGRYGRAGYGLAVFFVFATMKHTSILGALLEDQQLAGLIMWIPAGMIFMTVALALFAAWIGESSLSLSHSFSPSRAAQTPRTAHASSRVESPTVGAARSVVTSGGESPGPTAAGRF